MPGAQEVVFAPDTPQNHHPRCTGPPKCTWQTISKKPQVHFGAFLHLALEKMFIFVGKKIQK